MRRRFDAISDPRSPSYQQFMTRDEIKAMSSPSPAVHEAIAEWLGAAVSDDVPLESNINDVSSSNTTNKSSDKMTISNHGDAIHVNNMPISMVSSLFDTRFARYHHHHSAASLLRQYGTYSIPSHVSSFIQFVDGISSFPPQRVPKPVKLKRESPTGEPLFAIVPQTVQAIYGLPDIDAPV
jgi:subtilase family serine protease